MLLDVFVKSTGITIFVLVFFVVLFLGGMFLNGYDAAHRQTDFLVPSTHQDSVVLRIYGDNLICAPLRINTKEVEKTFFVIKSYEEPIPQLRLVRLGPLTSIKMQKPGSQD